MAWLEAGDGDPLVFLHGNPTSGFLWRNIWPALTRHGRCLIPDLIGMGESAKLPDSGPGRYNFATHAELLDAWLSHVGADRNVTLIAHDWGSALAFDWARRNPAAVRGIAYMEGIVMPMTWDQWPEVVRNIFQGLRSDAGEEMVLDKNVFVERILPGSVLRELTAEEMAVYRRPFLEPGENRRPTLDWPRQIPLDGEPAEVCRFVQQYADWLSRSDIPKLFINAEPGAILVGEQRDFCRSWPNQTEVTVAGSHFMQEDSPQDIAAAIANWLTRLD
jgi:haloalkane dehalogenase